MQEGWGGAALRRHQNTSPNLKEPRVDPSLEEPHRFPKADVAGSAGSTEPTTAARDAPAGAGGAAGSHSPSSSSATQGPSLSARLSGGHLTGCSPPGFVALISRQPDLNTAGSGSPVPMESATQEAAKPFLCAGRKGALLACPGGQRESRGAGLWESKRTNGAKQSKKKKTKNQKKAGAHWRGGRGARRAAIPRINCRCSKSVRSPPIPPTALHPLRSDSGA